MRAPFPTLHLLRHADLLDGAERAAADSRWSAETITARNSARLGRLGLAQLRRQLDAIRETG